MRSKTVAARLFLATSSCALATAALASETTTYSYDALGRLVATTSSGTVNNGLATSIAYDPAGNRSCYTVTGAATGSGGACGSGPPPPPPPSPPPPPPSPPPPPPPPGGPVANPDGASVAKCSIVDVNVVANDTDPGGHYPLTVTGTSGATKGTATVVNASTIEYESFGVAGSTTFSYTVQNATGQSATGSITITISGGVCQ
jgi:YD repeat-containing protein